MKCIAFLRHLLTLLRPFTLLLVLCLAGSLRPERAFAEHFCERLYRYHVEALALFEQARAVPLDRSRDLVARAHRALDKGWTDPVSGEVSGRGYQECDKATQQIVDASNLLANFYSSLDDDSNLSFELAALSYGPPNHYISTALFRNLLVQTVSEMRKRHDAFDESVLTVDKRESRAHALERWRSFFLQWLGRVPPALLPDN